MIAYVLKKQTLVKCFRTRKTKDKVPKEYKVIVTWRTERVLQLENAEKIII